MRAGCVCAGMLVKCLVIGFMRPRGTGAGMARQVFKIVLIKPSHYDARRLRHPVVALDHPVEQPCQRLRPADRVRAGAGARSRRRHRDRRLRRVQHHHRHQGHDRQGPRRRRRDSSAWSACSRISIRARSISRASSAPPDVPVVIGGFHVSGCISMLPKLPADLQEALDLGVTLYRRRRRRPPGRRSCVTLRPAPRSRPTTTSPTCPRWRRRPCRSCRARIVTRVDGSYTSFDAGRGCPFQCSLLHHHQRAGPQVALPHAGRRGRDRPRQCQAGHHQVLRHRRQLRPQQELGADPRPADRAARERGLQDPPAAAGRHAVPPHSRLHREGGARGLQRGVHRAGEHQSRNRCSAPRSARTRSGNIARCSRPGASRRS